MEKFWMAVAIIMIVINIIVLVLLYKSKKREAPQNVRMVIIPPNETNVTVRNVGNKQYLVDEEGNVLSKKTIVNLN